MSIDCESRANSSTEETKAVAAGHRLAHRSPARDHLYASASPLRWSEELDCWLLFDPAGAISVLKNPVFQVIDYESAAMKIADGLGIDLSATTSVIRHLPLAQEGCPHAALRRQMAVQLGDKPTRALSDVDAYLQAQVPLLFSSGEEFDIVAALLAPLVDRLIAALSGIPFEQDLDSTSPSQLFDKLLSLNRRKLIERKLRDIYHRAGGQPASANADIQVALIVLGADALLGSLGESFLHTVRSHPGKPLSQMAWSERIPATGVPYLDRMATAPGEVCGQHIRRGERVRVYLDAFRHAGSEAQDAYFGAGRHTCLGRVVSQKVWQKLAASLAGVCRQVSIGSVAYRPSDYVFNCPISIMVSAE